MNVETFLKNLGLENQPIVNKGSGSDWDLISILERFADLKESNNTFEDVARIGMKYMNNNHHPHTQMQITNTICEILEGIKVHKTDEYLND